MNTYKLGIMSSTWTVEAENIDIAVIALRLTLQTSAPIVCYGQDEQSKFMLADTDIEALLEDFMKDNIEAVRASAKTIEKQS